MRGNRPAPSDGEHADFGEGDVRRGRRRRFWTKVRRRSRWYCLRDGDGGREEVFGFLASDIVPFPETRCQRVLAVHLHRSTRSIATLFAADCGRTPARRVQWAAPRQDTISRAPHAGAHLSPERRLATDSKQLARTPAFVGIIVLLYTIGSGLALGQAAEQIEAAALQRHSIAGIVGTILCFVGIAIVIHQSGARD